MNDIIRKTWNSYRRHDGYVMAWERSETADRDHRVSMLDDRGEQVAFQWRSANEPVAGQKISVVMVEDGVTARPDRPVLVLNHETGDVVREQNAPKPRGARPIMIGLTVWVIIAMIVSGVVIGQTEGLTMMVLTLLAAALVIWRLAIATAELRADERMQKRIQDEEKVCMEIMTGAWRLTAGEVFNLQRSQVA